MATSMESCRVPNNLHQIFENLEMNSNSNELAHFKTHILMSGAVGHCWRKRYLSHVPRKLYKCDGFTFLKFLESKGKIDETNTKLVQDAIKAVKSDHYELVTHRTCRRVEVDPVVDYLERTAPPQPKDFCSFFPFGVPFRRSGRLKRKRKETTSEKIEKKFQQRATESPDTDKSYTSQTTSAPQQQHQQVYSCDVRLRVKVEYVDHQEVLGNSVHSHKQTEIERQFEKFSQASNILKSRDLGTVVCDIKFSELTSLDAFWRDYTNGALLEALNVVFITESLSEAVGHEPLRLLVSVDEEDYRKGRLILLKNLIT